LWVKSGKLDFWSDVLGDVEEFLGVERIELCEHGLFGVLKIIVRRWSDLAI
jgi:hypothetical protein